MAAVNGKSGKSGKAKGPEITVEELLAEHTPAIREAAERLRRIVAGTVPQATEKAHGFWHSINYRHPDAGYFCGIFPRPDAVLLVFEFGVLLPDPEGILEGDGKQVRQVRIERAKDIRVRPIRTLLREAVELPGGRDEKLAMIRTATSPPSR